MRRYQCHKQVNAIRIDAVHYVGDGKYHLSGDGDCVEVHMSKLPDNAKLAIGGYAIMYEGGYNSWSPADVFEAGYTEIEA